MKRYEKGEILDKTFIVQVAIYLSTRIFEIGSKLLLATCEKEGWRLLMCWILGSMFKDWLMQSSRRKYLKQGNRSSILPSSRQPLYFTVVKKWDGDVILDSDHLEHVLQTDKGGNKSRFDFLWIDARLMRVVVVLQVIIWHKGRTTYFLSSLIICIAWVCCCSCARSFLLQLLLQDGMRSNFYIRHAILWWYCAWWVCSNSWTIMVKSRTLYKGKFGA